MPTETYVRLKIVQSEKEFTKFHREIHAKNNLSRAEWNLTCKRLPFLSPGPRPRIHKIYINDIRQNISIVEIPIIEIRNKTLPHLKLIKWTLRELWMAFICWYMCVCVEYFWLDWSASTWNSLPIKRLIWT